MAAESGEARARRFHALAEEREAEAERYRRLAASIEKGNAGERRIADLLDVLDGAGWRVLHDRYKTAGSPTNLDHIVIGPPGVFVVDAKNWSCGRLALDERGMRAGRYRRDQELSSAREAADAVASRVGMADTRATTYPVLAFVEPVGLDGPTIHQGVALVQQAHLLPWLTSWPQVLDAQAVQRVASTLDAALPPRSGPSRPLTVPAGGLRPTARRQAVARPSQRPAAAPPPRSRGRRRRGDEPLRVLVLKLAALAFLLLVVVPALLQSAAERDPAPSPAVPSVPPVVESPP